MKQLLIILLALPITIQAQNIGGLNFLLIGSDAISLGSSETTVARKSGSANIFNNPGLMALEKKSNATATYTFWLNNTAISTASVLVRSEKASFGLGVIASNTSGIEARQQPGPSDGNFSVSYYAFSAGYGRKFGELSAGISATYLYEQIFQLYASGYAFNIGSAFTFSEQRITLGSAVLNLGKMEKIGQTASNIPTIWKSGIHADVLQFSVSGSNEIPVLISISSDLSIPLDITVTSNDSNDRKSYLSTALQLTVSDIIELRTGFRTGSTSRPLSYGFGLRHHLASFQYAFIPFETGYNNTHSLSISFAF